MTRYLLVGGGTAGHVNPLLAVADRIRQTEPDAVIVVLGTREGLESRLVPARGYELVTIDRLPFPRKPNRSALRFPKRFRTLVDRVAELIREHRIDVVVGFGGYVSAPAYLAARRTAVPIVIHEANAVPGMANRLGARFTRFVGVAFAGTRLRGARYVGMPLRQELERLDRRGIRPEALAFFGLDERRPVLLVTGGSLGALRINETVNRAAASIIGAGWQLLHIVGERSELRHSELADYRILPYCDRMDLAYAAADLVLARSGSGTVSEVSALGLPAVYVPLPIGNGEQRKNARGVEEAGGAIIVDNAQFTPEWVGDVLVPLLQHPAATAHMAARAETTGVRDGTDRTIALIHDALAQGHTR
ncbi:UDP-N-acetylglucosamine--N-acetylmuramyl-(pentapeptide) pyrophosphoryl-undecaprenol N-acetylglucosamine transferase [Cryobacterium sp. BB307]|uniref:glycosyltransferase n=1 Tax=Cryobacterium sp. BB307 TaxID=2716317 RepID=UPI001445243D